jgi:hypothetical protein
LNVRRAALLALAGLALPAVALETPQWPPPEGVEARMHELQQVIIARESTLAQRDTARAALIDLLKSPAGRGQPTTDKHPARAAIEPLPSVVAPVNVAPSTLPAGSVARIEVIEPPKAIPMPPLGLPPPVPGRAAVDPRTGAVLHGTAAGYVDSRTGQFIPR